MSEERRLAVLRAIVQDYVQTSEPVGSKALLERHHLGVSAATVRNDMAALEEEGLIAAPHTSAGRVPDRRRLPAVRRPAQLGQADDRRRAARHRPVPRGRRRPRRRRRPHGAAARLADPPGRRHAVPVADPLARCATSSSCRSGPSRLMVVLIVNTGRVEQRVIETADDLLDARTARRRSASCAAEVNAARRRAARSSRRPPRSQALADAVRARRPRPGARRRARRSTTRSSRSARSGSCWPAPPTSPGSAPTSR